MSRSPFIPVVSYIKRTRPAAAAQSYKFGKSAPRASTPQKPDFADSAFPGAKHAKARLTGKPIRPKRRRK